MSEKETVKELRRLQSEADRGGSYAASWLDEAADLLESQAKRIEELERERDHLANLLAKHKINWGRWTLI